MRKQIEKDAIELYEELIKDYTVEQIKAILEEVERQGIENKRKLIKL